MIISIDVINPFFPSPILVHDNDVQETLNERDFLNIIQGIYQKLLASVIVTLKYRKIFPRSETRQECLLLLQVHNFVLEFIARKIRCEKNKSHPNLKGRSKTVFTGDIILYAAYANKSTESC